MAENLTLVDPRSISRNPENPRLVFREEELEALQQSIAKQGILVPLTVFGKGREKLVLLDGERRWRVAIKLQMPKVPVIIQPEPDKVQNIMMMFAIHNARKDWDDLPAAEKLVRLESLLQSRFQKKPTERELAESASIKVSQVRRYKKLASLPQDLKDLLLAELEKRRVDQNLRVDHVLEAQKAVSLLTKRKLLLPSEGETMLRALVNKFRTGIVKNTVDPRKLARIARAVERGEVAKKAAHQVLDRLMEEATYTIDDAFRDSVEKLDFEHTLEQLAERVSTKVNEMEKRHWKPSIRLSQALMDLRDSIGRLVR